MKQLLTFGCALALVFAVVSFTEVVKSPSGFAVVKGGSVFAADLPLPPPPAAPIWQRQGQGALWQGQIANCDQGLRRPGRTSCSSSTLRRQSAEGRALGDPRLPPYTSTGHWNAVKEAMRMRHRFPSASGMLFASSAGCIDGPSPRFPPRQSATADRQFKLPRLLPHIQQLLAA